MTQQENPADIPRADLARSTRQLIRRLDRAALATLLPSAGGAWPYASLVLVALDHDLAPLLLLSDLAEHSKAIAADGRASLLFDGTAGLEQPLTGSRVTLLGRAGPTEDERLRRRFLARHPDAALYAGFGDFRLYRMTVERAHLVGGFGKIAWLDARDLLARPPPLALVEAEEAIVAHMNEDHADAVELYATRLLDLPASGWKLTGVDAEGADIRSRGGIGRLEFPTPVGTPDEARRAFISLAAKARGR